MREVNETSGFIDRSEEKEEIRHFVESRAKGLKMLEISEQAFECLWRDIQ
jgi:hypothetical protein